MEVVGDVKAFEVSSGSFPVARTVFQSNSEFIGRPVQKERCHLAGTMGGPLFHLGGTLVPTQAEGAEGPGALRRPEQGCVGGKACRPEHCGCRGVGAGGGARAMRWLFGKGIVLLLLTKPQPTCRAWPGTYNWPG